MDERIKNLQLEDKAKLLVGYKTMSTYPINDENIRSLQLSDGPNGLRKENDKGDSISGISDSLPATCFPTGVSLASSWDKKLLYDVGKIIGKECNYYNVNVLLGPAINIKRNPKCGRNFEYYSEDPLLSGYLASEFVKGVQSQNVAACLKHFACNNNELYRFVGDSIVDQRALHEIYLKPFELAIKNSSPWAIMNSYNKVNGIHASENTYLLKDILRNKWSYNGLVMTDWGGIVSRVDGLKASTDLEMPGMVKHNVNSIINAVKENKLDEKIVDESVDRLLTIIDKTSKYENKNNFDENYQFAIEASKKSAVLLKNKDDILPLNKNEKIMIVGGLFSEMRYQGSGSSLINPYKLSYHKDSLESRKIEYSYYQGYKASELTIDEKLESDVLNNIKNTDTILFYCGQNDYVESEGFDRESMSLPDNQLSLLNKLIKLKKKIILVLFGGSSIELPFIDDIDAVLYMGLSGEGIGEATTSLLFGEVSPSGRLTETWPIVYDDVIFSKEFTSNPNELYKESIYVGYRYYSTIKKNVRFSFGYGLSYSNFEFSNFEIEQNENEIILKGKIKNLKNINASEVVQIYTNKKISKVYRPLKELKGFEKVELKPYEEKEIKIYINKDDLKVYDVKRKDFVLESGEYNFIVSRNVEEEIQTLSLSINGLELDEDNEIIKKYYHEINNLKEISNDNFKEAFSLNITPYVFNKRPYTFETQISEFNTFIGKFFRKVVCSVGLKRYKKACKMKDSPEKEREKKAGLFVYKLMPTNSLRSLCYSSSGQFPYKVALALVEFVNNRIFKGIKILLRKEK